MNKEETIKRYGEAAWQKHLAQRRAYKKAHRKQLNAYRKNHPEEAKVSNQEQDRKGGRRYAKKLEYMHTGLQGDRNKVRYKHGRQYRPYKQIIAPDSQIHHEWIPNTSEYKGVALVEKDAHMHGFVDVIQIIDGEITLLTEEEVKKGV